MKTKVILLIMCLIGLLSSCNQIAQKKDRGEEKALIKNDTILGKWIRSGQMGPMSLNFTENGLLEGDFGNDQKIDLMARYEIHDDTITFQDIEGPVCPGKGIYKMYRSDYWISFDVVDDTCNGRIKTTMGFWTKPGYEALLAELTDQISRSPEPEYYLDRARLYMATGNSIRAKADLDRYISFDSTNARAYINRAGTRFPGDMEGVITDCNKAIDLDPSDKNSFFLRGLALYELGRKGEACQDFTKAIELGFTILAKSEQEKCAEYW
jgi:tetratricopeptide (TPR) repeat protein